MNNPWTPGPWRVDPNFVRDVQTANGSKEVCTPYQRGDREEDNRGPFAEKDEAEANARLIAAAPEMAEALEQMTAKLEECGYRHSLLVEDSRALLARIRGDAP